MGGFTVPRTLRRIFVVAWLCISVAIAPTGFADTANERERHAAILIKALTYDAKMVERAGREMVVAVLYSANDSTVNDEADAWLAAFEKLTSMRFLGLPFRALKLPFSSTERLRKAIVQEGIDAVFVVGVTKDSLTGIENVSRERKVLTLASRQEQVTAGLTLGVFVIDGKNTLLINLTSSREEGAAFRNEIFALAKVIK